MSRILLPLACAVAALSGQAARSQPNPDQAADLAAIQAVQAKDACLVARAKTVDDHVSAPEKIAALMKDACSAEEDRAVAAANAWAERHHVEKDPPTLTPDQRLGLAALAVQMARGEGGDGK